MARAPLRKMAYRMQAARFIAVLLAACAGFCGLGAAVSGQVAATAYSVSADSTAYVRRAPLPYHLGYLQAIKYIDDGMKYVDAFSGLSISPLGQMCFRQLPNSPLSVYDNYYSDWCAYPYTIGRVEIRSDGVELWCAHSYPQCARRLAYPNPLEQRPLVANSITIQVFPNSRERGALEDLIFAMGGDLRVGATGQPE